MNYGYQNEEDFVNLFNADTPTAKACGFLCTSTSKYTRKYTRLMSFHKTFTTKDTFVSISDSIRLVSKP